MMGLARHLLLAFVLLAAALAESVQARQSSVQRVFFFGHSLTFWGYPEGPAPEDYNRGVGTGLSHLAAAAGFEACAHGSYPTSGPGLARVQADYGQPPSAPVIDSNGAHRHQPSCEDSGGFAELRYTHFVTVPNNFNIETAANGDWLAWALQSFFAGDTDQLFAYALSRHPDGPDTPQRRLFWYEVPPSLDGDDGLTAFDLWVNDLDTGPSGSSWSSCGGRT